MMKGVWLENKKLSFREDIPQEFPDNEVVVKMIRSGICNTDLELISGYYPYTGVLGHEFVGVVVGPPSNEMCGKRVVGEINCVCNACRFCEQGLYHQQTVHSLYFVNLLNKLFEITFFLFGKVFYKFLRLSLAISI